MARVIRWEIISLFKFSKQSQYDHNNRTSTMQIIAVVLSVILVAVNAFRPMPATRFAGKSLSMANPSAKVRYSCMLYSSNVLLRRGCIAPSSLSTSQTFA